MQDTLNIFSMRKSSMKPGHIKQSEHEEKLHETGHILQSTYDKKLHEARTH